MSRAERAPKAGFVCAHISLHRGLSDRTPVEVVAHHKGGEITVRDFSHNHWRVSVHLIDFGKEWRFECPRLPEGHPKVLEHLRKLCEGLRTKPDHPVPVMNVDANAAIEDLTWTIERHDGKTRCQTRLLLDCEIRNC